MPTGDPPESLGLGANQWKFLDRAEKYILASDATKQGRKLSPASTQRQFETAAEILKRLTGSANTECQRGVLLADDVGLGKTTVAALVAWVVARAGSGRQVRILAPNDVMVRRWRDELLSHVAPLGKCAKHLGAHTRHVRIERVDSLKRGTIQVVKHSYASAGKLLACDLLIVDEAHRAKGENSAFSRALKAQRKHAKRTLILTATPFSIQLEELNRMLSLVGAVHILKPLRDFSRARDQLYASNTAQNANRLAERLVTSATRAVSAIAPYVIRHGIDQLPAEQDAFGNSMDWRIEVPHASADEVSLMLRIDRVLRLLPKAEGRRTGPSNDPRFHVGWQHLDAVVERVEAMTAAFSAPIKPVVSQHLDQIRSLRRGVGVHSKMRAVGVAVRDVVTSGEKVVIFCHHHATAQELALHLSTVIPPLARPTRSERNEWRKAWSDILQSTATSVGDDRTLEAFINWLTADAQLSQVSAWLPQATGEHTTLSSTLEHTPARHKKNPVPIASAAQMLYQQLCSSSSGVAVLRNALTAPSSMPAGAKATRVFATCQRDETAKAEHLFLQNQQPDTVMAIFNSPFGPEALVVTDRLSEGVDLHKYCRHLVHYELDPSPIRTVQRNGRLRRVSSWAAIVGEPIRYAYPAFRGTRDQRLVEIMQKRLNSFSLLLGGVQSFDVDTDTEEDERWRDGVIAHARRQLQSVGLQLCCGAAQGNVVSLKEQLPPKQRVAQERLP